MPDSTLWTRIARSVVPMLCVLGSGIIAFVSVRSVMLAAEPETALAAEGNWAETRNPGTHLGNILGEVRENSPGRGTISEQDAPAFAGSTVSGWVATAGGENIHSLEFYDSPAVADMRWRQLSGDSGTGTGRFGSAGWASVVVLAHVGLAVVVETDGTRPNDVHRAAVADVQRYQAGGWA